jgi:hypothetical protein
MFNIYYNNKLIKKDIKGINIDNKIIGGIIFGISVMYIYIS